MEREYANIYLAAKERWEKWSEAAKEHFRLFNEAIKNWRTENLPKSLPSYFDFDPNSGEGDPRCTCASACFFMWAAGAEKRGDVIQIHRPYFDPTSFAKLDVREAEAAYRKLFADARSYLAELGVPNAIIERMFRTSSDNATYLSADELNSLRMPAYFEELKLARCGPEPRLEDQSNAPLDAPAQGNARYLSNQQRRFLMKKILRVICWRDSQTSFRRQAITAYLRDGKAGPTQNMGRSGKGPATPNYVGPSEVAEPPKNRPANKENREEDFKRQLDALDGAEPETPEKH